MDTEFKTTFIPKKNLKKAPASVASPRRKMSRSLLGIIATLLFVSAVISAVGVLVYKSIVTSSVNSKIEVINRAEKAFEPAVILELRKLDIRLAAAKELLDNHIALSDFFASLEESTLPDVAFGDFSLTFREDIPTVRMSGEARGYLAIAQQSDIFEANQYIENPLFADFSLTETGEVSFNLEFTINEALLAFGRVARRQQEKEVDTSEVFDNLDDITIVDEEAPVSSGESVEFNVNQ
jgi:hypothetical protein